MARNNGKKCCCRKRAQKRDVLGGVMVMSCGDIRRVGDRGLSVTIYVRSTQQCYRKASASSTNCWTRELTSP